MPRSFKTQVMLDILYCIFSIILCILPTRGDTLDR